jgi:dihydrofolate reductase
MRKIIVSVQASLDGIMSGTGPEGDPKNLDWIMPGVMESTPYMQDLLGNVDTILMGRVTYWGLSQFWPTQTGDFADRMNKTPKIVFSKSGELKKAEWGNWNNITLIDKNAEERARQLKQQPGKDMIIVASGKLVQSFTNADLIDDYRIFVHPVILGSGKRLFDHIQSRHSLMLVDIIRYAGGSVLLHYEVDRNGHDG